MFIAVAFLTAESCSAPPTIPPTAAPATVFAILAAVPFMLTFEVKPASEFNCGYEAKVFISERRMDEYHLLCSFDVQGCGENAAGGLILTDVNFDGINDILVCQGHFGAQGMVRYACYLGSNGAFELNESFSEIANPSLDTKNRRVLSTWRNRAASHSWAMYSYISGEFIETDRLTQEPSSILLQKPP